MAPVLDPEGTHLSSLRRLADFKTASVIEVGCGDGKLTSGLTEEAASVFAFDPEADAFATAKAQLAAELAERAVRRVGALPHAQAP